MLVVLLIGIIAVIQLFPGGFLTIARTGEQTLASQLANQQLEAMRALPVQPDNIVPALPDDQGNIHVISSIRPDDFAQETDTSIADYSSGSKSNPNDQFTLPAGYGGYFFSDINRWRYVKGETLHVPVANPNVKNSGNVPVGSFYTLQFGPVYNYFNSDAAKNPNGCSIKVYGAALTRTLQSALASLNQPSNSALLQNDNQYAIDYANHQIAFFPRVGKATQGNTPKTRSFTISLDYYNTASNPPVLMHLTGSIPVQDLNPAQIASGVAPQPMWQEIFLQTNFPGMTLPSATDQSNIRAESEDVSRQFKLITTDSTGSPTQTFIGATNGPQWSDDPYEYAWYSAQQGSLNANPGTLLFNPNGYLSFSTNGNVTDTQTQIAAQSYANASAIVARVDYMTYDNHIIRDQRTMPSNGPYTIKLSLPNVMAQGDLLDDGSTYTGIFPGTSPSPPDILVLDANDGTEICDIQQGASTGNSLVAIDSLNTVAGTITFKAVKDTVANSLPGVEDLGLQGRPLRILYRTQQNWGQQVQKASSMYTPVTSAAQVTYTTYFVGDGTNGSSATRIYFAPSESGKTVNIGEFYLMTSTGIIFAPFKNETFQILNDPTQYDAMNLPYIDITTTHAQSDNEHLANGATAPENITGFSAKPTGRAINTLRGLSIKSRVMWKSSNRFRRIDQESILPTDRL